MEFTKNVGMLNDYINEYICSECRRLKQSIRTNYESRENAMLLDELDEMIEYNLKRNLISKLYATSDELFDAISFINRNIDNKEDNSMFFIKNITNACILDNDNYNWINKRLMDFIDELSVIQRKFFEDESKVELINFLKSRINSLSDDMSFTMKSELNKLADKIFEEKCLSLKKLKNNNQTDSLIDLEEINLLFSIVNINITEENGNLAAYNVTNNEKLLLNQNKDVISITNKYGDIYNLIQKSDQTVLSINKKVSMLIEEDGITISLKNNAQNAVYPKIFYNQIKSLSPDMKNFIVEISNVFPNLVDYCLMKNKKSFSDQFK